MTLADLLAAVGALVLLGSGFAALVTVLSVVAPAAVERARGAISRPGWTAALGLLTFLATLTAAVAFVKSPAPPVKLLGVATLLLGLSLAALGGAGLARGLGERTAVSGDLPMRTLLRGAALLGFSCLLPLVGWLVVFPVAFLLSLGAGVRALLGGGARPLPSPVAIGA